MYKPNKDIAEVINTTFKLSVDKKKVVMETIKIAGTYDVEIKLYPEVSTKIKVKIHAGILGKAKPRL